MRTVRAKTAQKTDLGNPDSLPNSFISSVSAMPWCNGLI